MRRLVVLLLLGVVPVACGDDGGGGTGGAEDPAVELDTPQEVATSVDGLAVTIESVTGEAPEPVVFEVTIGLDEGSSEPAAAVGLRLQAGDQPFSGRLVAGDDTVERGDEVHATIQVDLPAGAAVDTLVLLDGADLIAELEA